MLLYVNFHLLFQNLRILDVSNNRISEIGNSFSLLPHITRLNLADNYIHIGSKDFIGLEHALQHLDLSNTSVSYVSIFISIFVIKDCK